MVSGGLALGSAREDQSREPIAELSQILAPSGGDVNPRLHYWPSFRTSCIQTAGEFFAAKNKNPAVAYATAGFHASVVGIRAEAATSRL
jgi:hypothetical protein